MTRPLLQPPERAVAPPRAAMDEECQEPVSERRDRRPIPELRPTVYCPPEGLHLCVAEAR